MEIYNVKILKLEDILNQSDFEEYSEYDSDNKLIDNVPDTTIT